MFVLQDFFFRTEQMQDRCGMYDTKEEKTLFSFGIITKIAGYVLLVCLTMAYPTEPEIVIPSEFSNFLFSLKFGLFFQSFLH